MKLLRQLHAWREGDRSEDLREALHREAVRRDLGARMPAPERLLRPSEWFHRDAELLKRLPAAHSWMHGAFALNTDSIYLDAQPKGIRAFPCFIEPPGNISIVGVVYRIPVGYDTLIRDHVYSSGDYSYGGRVASVKSPYAPYEQRFKHLMRAAHADYTKTLPKVAKAWTHKNMDLLVEWLECDLHAKQVL